MNNKTIKMKNAILKFIFITVIFNTLRVLYKIFLYRINEALYMFVIFLCATDKEDYDVSVAQSRKVDRDARIFWHSAWTLIEAMLVLITITILKNRGIL